ncbi:SDR family oxidoreductase [Roseofilum casamattae]|uniref:SDR family oxidoreductase n=1 Tax=Roseofilum casamattae BLCC-M143 TaxID=3022442 RepID=A0ABT7BSB0_9CYAN|nr:SDR family oxidoreductase [Roseofilum casamattae]MDJ1181657.1 SDR family oxidoreductase [Roseofilum casamattae BLCC-M143]
MDLNQKVALVTGGGVRLGRALVLALAKAGCDVFIHYGQSKDAANEVKQIAESFGVRAVTYSADLADATATDTIIPQAIESLGKVDILINSASIFLPEQDSFLKTNIDLWNRFFNINLRAQFQLSQAFAHYLLPEGKGKIINLNDSRITYPQTDNFTYRLTKRGLWEMTEIMALELAPNITVNALALGTILEPPGTPNPDKFLQEFARENIPLQIPASLKVVTDSALFLLQHDFLTGTTLTVDGGQYIYD